MKRSPIRQALRAIRFILAVAILALMFAGMVNVWIAAGLYVALWIAFMAVDAPIAWKEHEKSEEK